jgi:hypothetical protein
MSLRLAVAGLLVLAVLLAWAGIARRWRRAAGAPSRAAWLALVALQPLAAALLWLALFPPPTALRGDRLVVATANTTAGELAAHGAGARVVALPEAPRLPGVARVPDLATALRAAPAPRLRVLGAGLVARDRDAVRALPVEFAPSAPPPGLTALWLPDDATVGQPLRVAGTVAGLAGGRVELRDPGERVVAQARVSAQEPFALQATPVVAGRLAYTLQLRDARGRVVERVSVPLAVAEGARPRLLLLAGGPSPELKYLRRWALDGGGAVDTRISLGAGVAITGGAPRLDAARLAAQDLAILDARSWRALDARARATLLDAVREGLGLLVRVDAPPGAAERSAWRALGIALAPSPPRTRATAALPADWLAPRVVGESAEEPPSLARQAVQLANADGDGDGARALLADADGVALGAWAPLGRGRVGLLWASESFRFALAGDARAYGRFWSAAIGPLARARGATPPRIEAAPWRVGQRGLACGLAPNASLRGPDGAALSWTIVADARTGDACAAAWPTRAGWHRIVQQGATRDVYVRAAGEAPGLRWQADREATQALVAASAAGAAAQDAGPRLPGPGRRWPWFCGWLLLAAAGWGLERRLLPAAPVPTG